MIIKRGDILLANLEPVLGSEQGRIRPCLVVQDDISNKYSPTTIVVPVTTTIPDKNYPSIVIVEPSQSGLKEKSTVLCNQIRAISIAHRVVKKLGSLTSGTMGQVDYALKAALAIP